MINYLHLKNIIFPSIKVLEVKPVNTQIKPTLELSVKKGCDKPFYPGKASSKNLRTSIMVDIMTFK